MVTRGEEGWRVRDGEWGGIIREFGTDMHTLPRLKWITTEPTHFGAYTSQLERNPHTTRNILCTATKVQHSQINKYTIILLK